MIKVTRNKRFFQQLRVRVGKRINRFESKCIFEKGFYYLFAGSFGFLVIFLALVEMLYNRLMLELKIVLINELYSIVDALERSVESEG